MPAREGSVLRFIHLIAVLVLMALGVGTPSLAQDWQEHRSTSGGYRLEFPGTPRSVTQSAKGALGTVEVTAMMVVGRTGAFLSNETPFPPQLVGGDPQTLLELARVATVMNVKGQLREERRLSVDGAPARWFVVDIPPDKVCVTQLVLVGNLAVAVTYVGRPGTEDDADVNRFIGSMRLIPR